MITKLFLKILVLSSCATMIFAQLSFEPHVLVSLPGENRNIDVSSPTFNSGLPTFICWENQTDINGFSIYRMLVSPDRGLPELIHSSQDSLLNPDVNSTGDVVWQELENDTWVINYFSQNDGEISCLSNVAINATQPSLSNSMLVFVQGSQLVSMNLNYQELVVLDTGLIVNPDLNPEAYSTFYMVAYEKTVEDTTGIFITSVYNHTIEGVSRFSPSRINKHPRFGTMGGITYQTLLDDVWSVIVEEWEYVHINNAKHPTLLTIPIPVLRDVEDWLVFYESDSIAGNTEIFASSFPNTGVVTNISNIIGDDTNPVCTILPYDSVAVFWEHKIDDGTEIWWAKDILDIQGGAVDRTGVLPENFVIQQSYPNPFNSTVTIRYTTNAMIELQITILDLTGRVVMSELVVKEPGSHAFRWDGDNVEGHSMPSGVYIAQISDNYANQNIELVLLK